MITDSPGAALCNGASDETLAHQRGDVLVFNRPRVRPRRSAPDGKLTKLSLRIAGILDRKWGWDRLPLPLSILTLIKLRDRLRRENLIDPAGEEVDWGPEVPAPGRNPWRSTDGRHTDPLRREMGKARSIFGRNIPIAGTGREDDGLLDPDPRTISKELLARKDFIPATGLNLLVAAWVQFEVHDWMSHGENPHEKDVWTLPAKHTGPFPHPKEMTVRRTAHDRDDAPTTYRNQQTHWWDASQVYGSTCELANGLRDGARGRLRLTEDRYPYDPPCMGKDGPNELQPLRNSWWAGLAMFHTLFAREHNAICERLVESHPEQAADGEWLYHTARMINAALIAKIHTLEWTSALLANPRTEWGLRINWWGLQGRWLNRRFGRLTRRETLSGIPGSNLSYYSVPYALTEEFLAVYRMHPLIPDKVDIRSHHGEGRLDRSVEFMELAGERTHVALDEFRMEDLFYSFGTNHPGQLVLHNYPNHLRALNGTIDLATIDILRDRERGVPRYNDFRRSFRLPPAISFEDFSDDPSVVKQLSAVYDNPELVDLMVGLYAEKKPDGFAFSDTAFRVFILMASRRLNSDRFFTYDYNEDKYTKEGLAWIEDNTLSSVLARHYPELKPTLDCLRNPFKPWDSPDNQQTKRRWALTQRFWNGMSRFKFLAAEPLHVAEPTPGEALGEKAFRDQYPDIPIEGLVVADRFPTNEVDSIVLKFIEVEERIAHRFPPAADGLPQIPADPRVALDAAYPARYRQRYRLPVRPRGYDELDLGILAVKSPYAYLLEKVGDGQYRWDLGVLDSGYELHPRLRSPSAVVEFATEVAEADGKPRLVAKEITSQLGRTAQGDPGWHAAQRMAMCAAATHITLVRHFNWIHLVAGERFALATNRLPSDHGVRRLLAPHVYATHFGNRLVTRSQLAPGGDFERLFSYTHAGLCALFEATATQFDLRSMNPGIDASTRGIADGAIEQPALENRQDLMDVIRAHVARYLRHCYESDDEITEDAALGGWIDELARMPGVDELAGTPVTRDGLIELLATLIYMVSVDHEIVDSAVWDYHLWSDVSAPRVYTDGSRMPLDVYQRLVNANFILNIDRTRLMDDFSYLALDSAGRQSFVSFSTDLHRLQRAMDRTAAGPWRIEPRNLKANINY